MRIKQVMGCDNTLAYYERVPGTKTEQHMTVDLINSKRAKSLQEGNTLNVDMLERT